MKKDEIKIGGTYLAKVSNRVVPVRIDAECTRGGWDAINLLTEKKVHIKSVQRLRCAANRDGSPQSKPEVQAKSDGAAKAPEAKAASAAKAKAEPKPRKVSALDAAAKVLGETGKPMTCQEMIDEMSRKKYWTSPNGATPHATLYAAILREIKTKGKEARFQKTERGKFASTAK
jgi:hypothetical protein